MPEITSITPQVKDKTRCNIYIDGRFYCGLTLETTVKNRLKVGQTVSLQYLEEIQLESEKNTAFDKALTHISATRKTEKQIRDFLTKKGYLPTVVNYAVEKMRGYGFLDDGEYAESYVGFSAKKKGEKLIRMELRAKGVSDEYIDGALDGLDEETQAETARTLAQKYMRGKEPTKENIQKAYRHLLGKGFDYEVAKNALSALADMDEE